MLTINGRKYAKNNSEMIDSLFQGSETAHGFYKVKRGKGRVAIELRNHQGRPMALISPDGVFVTAFVGDDALTRYMFGLTKESREFLGFSDGVSYRDELTMATDALAEVILS